MRFDEPRPRPRAAAAAAAAAAAPPPPRGPLWIYSHARGKAVTISCTDQRRSEAFYRDVLGAVPLPGDGYGCPWFRLGDLVFSLMPNAEAATPASFPRDAMTMLWLEVDDLPAAHRRLGEAGVPIVDAPKDGPYLTIADPDGLLIEVWERDHDEA